MSLICIRIHNSFTFEWLCTRTRFETETCSNSEMGYSHASLVINWKVWFLGKINLKVTQPMKMPFDKYNEVVRSNSLGPEWFAFSSTV